MLVRWVDEVRKHVTRVGAEGEGPCWMGYRQSEEVCYLDGCTG